MRLLVIQHSPIDGLGLFQRLLEQDNHDVTVFRPDLGGPAPDLAEFDGLWVMGGAMQVWEANNIAWLRAELDLVRHAVADLGLPYFGVCLGHQILAHVLGGQVAPARVPEIGFLPVQFAPDRPEFRGLDPQHVTFHFHSAEVATLPPDAQVIASSDNCRVQAMAWGDTATSVQFHPEIDLNALRLWATDPEVEKSYDAANGQGAFANCLTQITQMRQPIETLAAGLYRNWLRNVSHPSKNAAC
jgi:GMP synthase-like glutamine amidotransferase